MSGDNAEPQRSGDGHDVGASAVQLTEVSKAYGRLRALDRVSINVDRGEVRAVVGENGAGKTTLMSIICGLVKPDSGEIRVGGEHMESFSARTAVRLGISYVQQHFSLIPTLTVAQNVELFLASTGRKVNSKEALSTVETISEEHSLHVNPRKIVSMLSVGDQQRAELVKALAAQPSVLVLDEPTALLSPDEASDLERILLGLADRGAGIIYVSHKLAEVMRLAGCITVIRKGRAVWSGKRSEATTEELGALMVGSEQAVDLHVKARPGQRVRPEGGSSILRVSDVSVVGERGVDCVREASLSTRPGEIVGMAGVEGSGNIELIEAIAGLRKVRAGQIVLAGRDITCSSVRARRTLGISFVPSDRKGVGLFEGMSVSDNLTIGRLGSGKASRWGLLRRQKNDAFAREAIDRYAIAAPGVEAPIGQLSGGNQQKLLLARELEARSPILLLSSPTWGLDFAARTAVHEMVLQARDNDVSVVIASVDLEELLLLSDRLIVFASGRVAGEVSPSDGLTPELGLMLGGSSMLATAAGVGSQ